MRVLFCTSESDKIGLEAISILKSIGCRVLVLPNGAMAPQEAVAIYSEPQPKEWFGGCYSITVAYRLMASEVAPKWARFTPFRAVFRGEGKGFTKAALQLALSYELWLVEHHGKGMPPWGMEPTEHGINPPDRQSEFKKWRDWANLVLADCSGWEKTPILWTKKTKSRSSRREQGWEL